VAQQPHSDLACLTVEVLITYTDTSHSVGRGVGPSQETSTWQHTTITRDTHPCPQCKSKLQSQQVGGHRPTP